MEFSASNIIMKHTLHHYIILGLQIINEIQFFFLLKLKIIYKTIHMSKFVRTNPLNKNYFKTLLGQAKSLNKENVALEFSQNIIIWSFSISIVSYNFYKKCFLGKSPPN